MRLLVLAMLLCSVAFAVPENASLKFTDIGG